MGKSLVSCFLTHGVVQAGISFSLMRFASPLARSCLADTSSLYGKERVNVMCGRQLLTGTQFTVR